jgi:hypothetical protein
MYRHLTNLRTPIDAIDARFLAVLGDYKIGRPVRAKHPDAPLASELKSQGIVGVYTTEAAARSKDVADLTGWFDGGLGKALLGQRLED